MITEKQRRNIIVKKLNLIPEEKLKEIEDFLSTVERSGRPNSQPLSYAGAWMDIDDSLFKDFTVNLYKRRESGRRRVNG